MGVIVRGDPVSTARTWAVNEISKVGNKEEVWGVYLFCVAEKFEPAFIGARARMFPGWYIVVYHDNPVAGTDPIHHMMPVGAVVPREATVRQEIRNGITEIRKMLASYQASHDGHGGG